MAFEEIKAGLEKYCKELEEKRKCTGTEEYEETPPTEEEKNRLCLKTNTQAKSKSATKHCI